MTQKSSPSDAKPAAIESPGSLDRAKQTRESRGLGRGLQALLSAQARPQAAAQGDGTLPIGAIRAGLSQPRKAIDPTPLEELAASIRSNGVIQPIVVRPAMKTQGGGPGYEIVAGERRWQAAKLAGLASIPVVIRDLSDKEAVAVALIENIQREELTPAEEARALQRLIDEFKLSHQETASAVGRSRAAVSNLIRLLDLPAEVIALIDAKAITMGHARALLGLEGDAARVRLARLTAERGLSVREVEVLVRKAVAGVVAAEPSPDPSRSALTEVLTTAQLRVMLQQQASGCGKLVVEFKDEETRDALIAVIRRAAEQGA